MNGKQSVIDAFYEAALIPELWPRACEALAKEVDATTTVVWSLDPIGTHRFVCTPSAHEIIDRASRHPLMREGNIRPKRALERIPFTFGREIDILTDQEFKEDKVQKELIEASGLQWDVGCVLQEPSGHIIMFDLHRRIGMVHFSDSAIAHLNCIKSDLARSVFLASRLAFSEAKSVASTLSVLGLPAFVLGPGMKVMATNSEAEELSPRVRAGAFNRLVLESRSAGDLLLQAFLRLQAGAETSVQSIPIVPCDGEPTLIVHLIPVRRSAHDIFKRGLAILVVTAVGMIGPPDMRVLSGLFDLTPAEARVARDLAGSMSVDDIASSQRISVETVRTHVKRIMAKTGTKRQAELLQLLLGCPSPIHSTIRHEIFR